MLHSEPLCTPAHPTPRTCPLQAAAAPANDPGPAPAPAHAPAFAPAPARPPAPRVLHTSRSVLLTPPQVCKLRCRGALPELRARLVCDRRWRVFAGGLRMPLASWFRLRCDEHQTAGRRSEKGHYVARLAVVAATCHAVAAASRCGSTVLPRCIRYCHADEPLEALPRIPPTTTAPPRLLPCPARLQCKGNEGLIDYNVEYGSSCAECTAADGNRRCAKCIGGLVTNANGTCVPCKAAACKRCADGLTTRCLVGARSGAARCPDVCWALNL